jgi:hypothetical protein
MKKVVSFLVVSFVVSVGLFFATPRQSEAVVYFGGSIGRIIFCINNVVYANLGAPRGGPYLWSPKVTKTYQFGPPRHSGQWLLGAAGPTYFCIESVLPLIVHPGLLILFMGSSQ